LEKILSYGKTSTVAYVIYTYFFALFPRVDCITSFFASMQMESVIPLCMISKDTVQLPQWALSFRYFT